MEPADVEPAAVEPESDFAILDDESTTTDHQFQWTTNSNEQRPSAQPCAPKAIQMITRNSLRKSDSGRVKFQSIESQL